MPPISPVRDKRPPTQLHSGVRVSGLIHKALSTYPSAFPCLFSPVPSFSYQVTCSNITSGAIWAGLVPTVIAVAIYFCFADFILISQCLYYNKINSTRVRHASITSIESEQSPLLTRRRSSDTFGPPNPHRRRSTGLSSGMRRDSATKFFEEPGETNPWVKNGVSILGTMAAGTAGWAIAWQSGLWRPTPEQLDVIDGTQIAVGAQVLGYISAVCYLG